MLFTQIEFYYFLAVLIALMTIFRGALVRRRILLV